MKSKAFLLFTLLALIIVWARSPLYSHAAVDLVSFTGYGDHGIVILEWETATELDNVGYYLVRSDTELGSYSRVSPFIATDPDSLSGGQYQYHDTNVLEGIGYWYQLEMIDTNTESTFHGPLQVIAGVFATQSSTGTATGTSQAGIAATSTRTPLPTRTRTPVGTTFFFQSVPSSTFSQFATPGSTGLVTVQAAGTQAPLLSTQPVLSVTETLTATATLVPVPEITMQFPVEVAQADLPNQDAGRSGQDAGPNNSRQVWFTLERLIFLGFILLVWVLLAGWFYLSYRRTEK